MRVMYLTWGETPRSYGVFNSQVLKQFIANSLEKKQNDEYTFVSAVPLIHSGMVREKRKYPQELDNIKNSLQPNGISFSRLPIFAPQNFVNSNRFTFFLFHLFSRRLLARKIRAFKADIVHCRSYHATWTALKVREKYNLDYKVVFDGRGIWPHEISLKKGYDNSSSNLKFLLKIEEYCLNNADSVIAVSDTMSLYYQSIVTRQIETIYLSSNTKKFKPSNVTIKKSDKPHFCYVGALDSNTWHKPQNLKELFDQLADQFPSSDFTIVTTSDHSSLRKVFSDFSNQLHLTSTRTEDELIAVLESTDIGVMSYFTPTTEKEKLLANSVMAVKTAEYLASGLGVIVNGYCGGAAKVIKEHDVGIVYFPDDVQSIGRQQVLSLLDKDTKERSLKLAGERFSYDSNAKKYDTIYRKLCCD